MAAQQEVTAWDENGKPVTTPDAGEGAAAWDENGKPIPVSLEPPGPPNSRERFTQVTTGFQHPVDELVREGKDIVHHPLEFGKDLAQTAGIPREFWSHPIREFKNIGGSGIPGVIFGEHGLLRDPIGTGERITGANELSEDVRSGNLKGIPGDIAGGVVNLAALKGPARQLGEQAAGARQALTPMRARRAPMGAYDENAQSWVPQERTPEIPAIDRRAVPIEQSPKYDPEAFKAGRLQAIGKAPAAPEPVFPGASQPSIDDFYEHRGREIDTMRRQQPDVGRLAPVRTSPFEGASSSANPKGDFPLPEPRGAQQPQMVRIEPDNPAGGRLEPVRGDTRATSAKVQEIVNQATGSQPLKADVPLREQLTPEGDPIKAKYPDPAVRQMVRANGEEIVQAANGNPETLKAIHDLTRVDLRQALINAGEDMGQQTVSNSKFAGEGSIGRQEAFARLLKKGISPEEIVRLAKQTPEGGRLQPVGEEPEIEVIEPNGPRGNASGEAGGGGLEEQSRQSSENAQGVKYFRESPGGGRQPLIGIGRQDLRAGPGQKIIRVEANGHETVLDAQPARAGALRPIRGKPRPAGH